MESLRKDLADGRLLTALALFVGSSALMAFAIAALSWFFIPYELLERFTQDERFRLWEGVVWLFALMFTFLGLAALLEVLGWQIRDGVAQLLASLRGMRLRNLTDTGPAVLPWWLCSCGLFLMLMGTVGRAIAAP